MIDQTGQVERSGLTCELKPVMGYLGSKAGAGVFRALIALMPPHVTYVELFAGTGAVLVRKIPATRSLDSLLQVGGRVDFKP